MQPMSSDEHSWDEYRRLVVAHMSSTDAKLDSINARLSSIEAEIATLKVKSGLWGAVAGAIATMGALLIALFAGLFR